MDQDDDSESEPIPILHQNFPRVRQPSKEAIKLFSEGFKVKVSQGKFSAEEDAQIKLNFAKFCEQYDLLDCSITRCALLGFTVEDEDQLEEYRQIKEIVKDSGFYYLLARKLPDRLISAVYYRARKLLDPFRKQSQLSQSEKLKIIKMAKRLKNCKNMFSKIGNSMNVSAHAVRSIIRARVNLKKQEEYNKGLWQPEETFKMIKIILNHLEIDIDQLTEDHLLGELPWANISERLGTRCGDSCQWHISSVVANLKSLRKEYKLFYGLIS